MTRRCPWGKALTWPEILRIDDTLALEADPKARAEIAERLELPALARLEADITLRPWLDGVEIDGRVRAEATRICGLSLEPFEVQVDEPFLVRVAPEGSPNA